jgi:hypothetical protein
MILNLCFINKMRVATFYVTEVRLHIFFTPTIVRDVLLTSKSDGNLLLIELPTHTEFEFWRDNHKGWIGQEKVMFLHYRIRTQLVQSVCYTAYRLSFVDSDKI